MVAERPRERLAVAVADAGSSGVAAIADGTLRFVEGDDAPVCIQSVTKLVVAFGAGIALSAIGDPLRIADEPLGSVFPQWRDDGRSMVTLGQLLAHTSGLVPVPPHVLEASEAPTATALNCDFDEAMVGRFAYNNAGPFLVNEAVLRLTGRSVDDWLEAVVFRPLALGCSWQRASDGTALAHGGLVSSAEDLARIGAAALASLSGNGPGPKAWVAAIVAKRWSAYPQPGWVESKVTPRLVEQWRAAGVDEALLQKVGPVSPDGIERAELLARITHEEMSALGAAAHGKGLRVTEINAGRSVGWGHDGDGSQWLVVVPDRNAAIAHTRSPANYHRSPMHFPPQLVLACL